MPRPFLAAALLAALLIPVLAAPAAAFPLSTCTLSLASTDASGAPLDTAQSGAPDSTVSDPFKVDWDGEVAYEGSTEVVIKNYTYHVEVFGVPTPLRGSDANDDENTDGAGSVSVGANSPFRVAGLYYVSGAYTGEGGSCEGSGWFQLLGSPIGTIPWIAGVVLTVLGALGVVAGLRGHLLIVDRQRRPPRTWIRGAADQPLDHAGGREHAAGRPDRGRHHRDRRRADRPARPIGAVNARRAIATRHGTAGGASADGAAARSLRFERVRGRR